MTSKRFWLGILVIVLVFGMTVVGCEDTPEEDTSVETRVIVTDVPSNRNGENFTMSLIYIGDGRTIATANGIITNDRVPGVSSYDPVTGNSVPVYSFMANKEFNWKWIGGMATKSWTGFGFDNERLYISGLITLRIGNDRIKTSNPIDILVGSVYAYGGGSSISLHYTHDFN